MGKLFPFFLRPVTGHLALIGPEANEEGDPYWWSVFISDKGELTGFSTKPATPDGFKTALHAANALGFKKPIVKRRGANPRTLEASPGVIEGTFTMHKALHAQHGAKLGDQHGNRAQVKAIAKAYMAKLDSDEMEIEHISEIDLGNGKFVRTFVIDESKSKS